MKILLVPAVAIFLALVAMGNTEEEEDLWYPLPLFTRVKIDSTVSTHSAVITVNYRAPDKPTATWYVDGFPIPENRVDFTVFNHYQKDGTAVLSLTRAKDNLFSLCLHNSPGHACLHLRRLPANTIFVEDLDFPWPLLIPAPLSRYHEGERMVVHAPELETPHNYNYSAHLISHSPMHATGRIVQADSHGMNGGGDRDVVSIRPASYGGWEIQVATDREDYEGVLFISTNFTTTATSSRLVQSVKADRAIITYRRDHRAPFSSGFVATVTQNGQPVTSPWRCIEGYDCLAECPLVSNGRVDVALNRVGGLNGGFRNSALQAKAVLRYGPYYGRAQFTIRNFNRTLDAGTYMCLASTEKKTAISSVIVD